MSSPGCVLVTSFLIFSVLFILYAWTVLQLSVIVESWFPALPHEQFNVVSEVRNRLADRQLLECPCVITSWLLPFIFVQYYVLRRNVAWKAHFCCVAFIFGCVAFIYKALSRIVYFLKFLRPFVSYISKPSCCVCKYCRVFLKLAKIQTCSKFTLCIVDSTILKNVVCSRKCGRVRWQTNKIFFL